MLTVVANITPQNRKLLLNIARSAINYWLEQQSKLSLNLTNYPSELLQPRACFVTLHKNQQLRGCIGTLTARSPLIQEVADQAVAAAFSDPRFNKVTASEIKDLQIDISVLTVPNRINFSSEQDLLAKLSPGVDGLIIKVGNLSSTFLPSVWEQIPDRLQFLQQLKLKAGLAANYWSEQFEAFNYQSEMFGED